MIDRSTLLNLLGPFPDRVHLDAHTIEIADCGSYLREKVSYYVEADERISAYVCIPKERSAKTPVVFCHHQHNFEFTLGKSEVVGQAGNPDQAYARELAQRGFITFAPDAIAFEERNWSGGTFEAEYYELASRLVRGQTLLAKVLHDASVGLDYLVSRPEVDTGRIGFLGHSYGGRMAIWLAALDRRIRATVSHCGCVGYADSLRRGAGIQMEFCVPGFMRHAEIEDIVALVAPTPLLLSAAIEDRWSRGAQRIYEAAKPAFANSDLELILWPGGHAFTRPMRDAAYGFLEKHLDVQHLRGDRPPNSSTAGQSIDSYPSSFRAK